MSIQEVESCWSLGPGGFRTMRRVESSDFRPQYTGKIDCASNQSPKDLYLAPQCPLVPTNTTKTAAYAAVAANVSAFVALRPAANAIAKSTTATEVVRLFV